MPTHSPHTYYVPGTALSAHLPEELDKEGTAPTAARADSDGVLEPPVHGAPLQPGDLGASRGWVGLLAVMPPKGWLAVRPRAGQCLTLWASVSSSVQEEELCARVPALLAHPKAFSKLPTGSPPRHSAGPRASPAPRGVTSVISTCAVSRP